MFRDFFQMVLLRVFAVSASIFLITTCAWCDSYKVLYNFNSTTTNPTSGLTADAAGNVYGTTSGAGHNFLGTVYELSPTTGYHLLHNFNQPHNGLLPRGNLAIDSAGNLYGTTSEGGADTADCGGDGCGVVFELSPPENGGPWTETVLYKFCSLRTCADGEGPQAGVILDSAGNLYGTTLLGGQGGGAGYGVVFELQHTQSGWTENVLYSFTGGSVDGGMSLGNLVFDTSGNLYGTTQYAGPKNGGTVFQLAPSNEGWTFNLVYAFDGMAGSLDGSQPVSGLILDASGNLYGTTPVGGEFGSGTVFELTPNSGGWLETILYNFAGGSDGEEPVSNVVMDSQGSLYGTTYDGGDLEGTVFKLTKAQGGKWTESLFRFPQGGKIGANPAASVILDSARSVYGTTTAGGGHRDGVVFRISQ